MDSKRILSLLGLALRGGNLAVGEEPVEAAARARDARVLLLAADAAGNTCRRAEHFAQAGQCLCLRTPFSKEELGAALGRTSVALAAVTDTGLANALLRRLAEGDAERYGEAAAQMELKAKRARERQAERLAHERNVRQGKKRAETTPERPRKAPKKAPPPPGRQSPGKRTAPPGSRRPAAKTRGPRPYAHSRPVKKGKGSFRKRDG